MSEINDKLRFSMIPAGYDTDVLFSQYPNVSASDFDVVRSGVATRVNKEGLIEEVAENVPRLDYSDGGNCPKLLTEVGSENYFAHSDTSNWVLSRNQRGISLNNKGVDGYFYSSTSANPAISISNTTRYSPRFYSYSFFIDSTNTDNCKSIITWEADFSKAISITCDFTNGSYKVENNNPTYWNQEDGRLVRLGDDFWRVELWGNMKISATSKTTYFTYYAPDTNAYNVWIGGVQNEIELSQATSYIPTNGLPQQRGTDSVTGAGDAETFEDVRALSIDLKELHIITSQRALNLNNGSTNEVKLGFNASNQIYAEVLDGGLSQASFGIDYDTELQNKALLVFDTNNFAIWINGIEFDSDNTGSLPSGLSTLDFDSLIGLVSSIKAYTSLTDDQYEAMTGYTSYQDIANQFGFKQL